MDLRKVFILALSGLTLLFIVQNLAIVEVQFLFWSFALPRVVLLSIIFAVGILTGWLLSSYLTHSREER
jgi:uncharacterized integral membrane protein